MLGLCMDCLHSVQYVFTISLSSVQACYPHSVSERLQSCKKLLQSCMGSASLHRAWAARLAVVTHSPMLLKHVWLCMACMQGLACLYWYMTILCVCMPTRGYIGDGVYGGWSCADARGAGEEGAAARAPGKTVLQGHAQGEEGVGAADVGDLGREGGGGIRATRAHC